MSVDRSGPGLDWLNFFVANVQTGFGPFIAVFLASQAWTQGQIGLALSIGTLTSVAVQVPAGAAVDAARSKRRIASFAVVAIAASAVLLAVAPERLPVVVAEVLHGVASCLLTPAIAALSLSVSRSRGDSFGERLGRNARFASIGSGLAAGLMGGMGYWVSERSVFFLAAVLVLPSLFALRLVQESPLPRSQAKPRQPLLQALLDRRLLAFALCCAGFHLANAAIFPVAAVDLTGRVGSKGALVIAACLVGPQVIVAALSPAVGRAAERWGRRWVLVLGFAAVPLRAALFGMVTAPVAMVAVQALDGVSAAVFGVMLPLVIADITGSSGRFNVSMGGVGLAIGGAAALSTEAAGLIADAFGSGAAFAFLTVAGVLAVAMVAVAMPETQPRSYPSV